MQYQYIIVFADIIILILILAFVKDYHTRKLLIISTISAYFMAAVLPYLLAWTSLNQTIQFYALAMGVIFLLAYNQYKSAESLTYNGAVVETAAKGEASASNEAGSTGDGESISQPETPSATLEAVAADDSITRDEPADAVDSEYDEFQAESTGETIVEMRAEQKDEIEDTGDGLESLSDVDTADDSPQFSDSIGDDNQPTATEEEPPASDTKEKPAAAIEEAPAITLEEQPAVVVEESPVTAVEEPPAIAAEEELPAAAIEEPPAITLEEQPAVVVGESPVTAVEEPPAIAAEEELPAAAVEEPPAITLEEQPAVFVGESPVTAVEEPPAIAVEEQSIDDRAGVIDAAEETWSPPDLESVNTVPEPVTDNMEGSMFNETVNIGVQTDIEDLIIKAFDARASGNYFVALTFLETILEQDPPEEIVNLILDDIEILFAKLAS